MKAFLLQVSAEMLRSFGYRAPDGRELARLSGHRSRGAYAREDRRLLDRVDPEAILAVVPHGTPKQVAHDHAEYVDAGLRVPKILDYGGMAGLRFAAASADNVREAEDELMRLCGDVR